MENTADPTPCSIGKHLRKASLFLFVLMVGCGTNSSDSPETNHSKEVNFIAVGDLMMSRTVARRMRETADPLWPVRNIASTLQQADVVFANLEGAICDGREIKSGEMAFHADPGAESALIAGHMNLVSLANNHFPDFGKRCMAESLTRLDMAKIAHSGAGLNDIVARQPAIIERNGLRIALLAFNDSDTVPPSYFAAKDHPGTAYMDIKPAQDAVTEVRKQADVVLVSMHAGWEYKKVNPRQQKFARAMIDAGADIVLGHHPHVVQNVENYKDKWIIYSLGNFVFDQTWSEETQESVMLKARMTANGVQNIQFIPIVIKHAGQPELTADEKTRKKILGRLEIVTDDYGTLLASGANTLH